MKEKARDPGRESPVLCILDPVRSALAMVDGRRILGVDKVLRIHQFGHACGSV